MTGTIAPAAKLIRMHPPVYNENLAELFASEAALLDVRSEIESAKGTMPNSVNLPILRTEERKTVGITYKLHGQAAAIEVGHELVSGAAKDERIEQWRRWAIENPQGALYCWRGGLRSKIAQEWLQQAGVIVPRVPGGYKALRRFLLEALERLCQMQRFIVIAGETGAGKTALLQSLAGRMCVLDLERHARHRGSAFGGVFGPQPAQQSFENELIADLLRRQHENSSPVFVEAESRMIGRLFVPDNLMSAMQRGAVVALEASIDERVETILEDYVLNNPLGENELLQFLLLSLKKLSKRLGPGRTADLSSLIAEACARRSPDLHRNWIRTILSDYYDPYYREFLRRNQGRIIFRGDARQVRELLSSERA